MHKHDPHERTKHFEEVDLGITTEEVEHEASRCLTCGCKTVYDCDLKDYSTEVGAVQRAYRGRFKKFKPDTSHPYVALDPNKCILCGRCVRYCGDLIGIYALGFVNRGFETVMKPAMDKPLAETTCIACGNCIEVCPTGAIEFNSDYKNPGVFRTSPKRSVCAECGVGCELDINAFDRDIFYITAKHYETYIEGELCKKGRFESSSLRKKDRIQAAVEDSKGQVTLDEAAQSVVKNLNEIRNRFGKDSILFLVSPGASNEEIFTFSSIAKLFDSSLIASAEDLIKAEFPDMGGVTGMNLSTITQDEVSHADLIINIGPGLTTQSPVFGFKVKRAVAKGAEFVQIGTLDSELSRYVSAHIDCRKGQEKKILDSIAGSMVKDKRFDKSAAERIEGFKELIGKLKKPGRSKYKEMMEELAGTLLDSSKKVVIIYHAGTDKGNSDTLKSAANLLLLTDRMSKPSNGIVITQNACNTQGYRDLAFGLFTTREDLKKAKDAMKKGKVKAVVSLNEELDIADAFSEEVLEGLEFVASLSMFNNSIARISKVLIPYLPLTESDGSIVSFDGRVLKFRKVFDPVTGHSNLDVLNRILHLASGKSYSIDYIREQIADRLPQYGDLIDIRKGSFHLIGAARHKGLFAKQLRFSS
jgi:formate dehydrogenase major subunit